MAVLIFHIHTQYYGLLGINPQPQKLEAFIWCYLLTSFMLISWLDINLFWDLSFQTGEGNFHLSELKIHLPTFFVWYSLAVCSVRTTAFSIKEGSNFTCLEWNLVLWGSCNIYMWYLWPFSVQGHFGVIQCACLNMACNSKTAGHRPEQSEIWDCDSRPYGGYLWPQSVKGHLVLKMACNWKNGWL